MGERLSPATPKEVVKIIHRFGFRFIRQTGSHAVYRHQDGRWTTVPMHSGDLGKGLLRKIIKDLDLTVEEFNKQR